MLRIIDDRHNRSLGELGWHPGELIAFDNTDIGLPLPFFLAVAGPEGLVRGWNPDAFQLIYWSGSKLEDREKWSFYPRGNAMGLYQFGSSTIEELKPEILNPYVVEKAYSGDEVIKALIEFNSFYGECLTQGLEAARKLGKDIYRVTEGLSLLDKIAYR